MNPALLQGFLCFLDGIENGAARVRVAIFRLFLSLQGIVCRVSGWEGGSVLWVLFFGSIFGNRRKIEEYANVFVIL